MAESNPFEAATGTVLNPAKVTTPKAEPAKPELKVVRIPTMIFVNCKENVNHESVKAMNKLLEEGFKPFAAFQGDTGHSVIFLFKG